MTTSSSSTRTPVKYLYDLDFKVLTKLCDVLRTDTFSWEELAGRLDFQSDIPYLRTRPNPPYELFVRWFARNGTVDYLFCILAQMRHQRAMLILKPYTNKKYHYLLQENDADGLGKSGFLPSAEKQIAQSSFLCSNQNTSPAQQSAHQIGTFVPLIPPPQGAQPSEKKFIPDPSNMPSSVHAKNFHETPKYEEQEYSPPTKELPPGACGGQEETIESITDNCAWLSNKKPLNIKQESPSLLNKPQGSSVNQGDALKKEINKNKFPLDDKSLDSLLDSVMKVSYNELLEATNGFHESHILGQGGFGIVYRAMWKGTTVAVKRLHPREGRDHREKQLVSFRQSLNELNILKRFRIDNILPLYGVCMDGKEPCLLYMFMVNGSLEDRLLLKRKTPPLTWSQRRQIAEGTAKGLDYLHTIAEKPLVHGDIKSANILLDPNMEPKIGDFGLAREGPSNDYTHVVVTSIHGTEPYLPPEYLRQRILSPKVDVYSYGVVLLEICTGLRALDSKRESNKLLVNHVEDHEKNKSLHTLRDAKAGEEGSIWFDYMLKIGLKCVRKFKKTRPEMSEVLREFDDLKKATASEELIRRKLSLETPSFNVETQQLSPMELQIIYDMKKSHLVPQQQTSLSHLMNEVVAEVRPPPEIPSYFKWPQSPTSSAAASSLPRNLPPGVREPPSSIPNGKLSPVEGQEQTDSLLSASSVAATVGNTVNDLSVSQLSPQTSQGVDSSNISFNGLDISGPCGPVPQLSGLIGQHTSMDQLDVDGPINISIGSNFSSLDMQSMSRESINSN